MQPLNTMVQKKTGKNKLANTEVNNKVDNNEDENEGEDDGYNQSETEEDDKYLCVYHKLETYINSFNGVNKKYMKRKTQFYKKYGQHGCRKFISEFSKTKGGVVAYHCTHKLCYYVICPDCNCTALNEMKENDDECDNQCNKRRRGSERGQPVFYGDVNNVYNIY